MCLPSIYPGAIVDNLLALENAPKYMNDHDMSNATFVRFIKHQDKDSSIMGITEVACRQYDQFIWCFDRSKADFPTSSEDRVVLSGLYLPDESDESFVSKLEPLFFFLGDLQRLEFDE